MITDGSPAIGPAVELRRLVDLIKILLFLRGMMRCLQ